MTTVSDYSIGQAAEFLGVSTRTLRHWHSIGLLVPSYRTFAEHRCYTEADLERALAILVYRAAGVKLKDIMELLDRPDTVRQRLQHQRELLTGQITHLHRMVRAVDKILEEDAEMSMEEKMDLFGRQWPEYQEEAEARWGNTPEWEQSQQRQQDMTRQDWVAVKAEMDSFNTALAEAEAEGVAPGSEAGDELALRHRASIGQWYRVSPAKQVLLARMYVTDQRFNETYQGRAAYLLQLVEARAEKEGVDLEEVQWQ